MHNDDEAAKAVAALDGKSIGGRNLKVNEARPKADRPREGVTAVTVMAVQAADEVAMDFPTKITANLRASRGEPRW
jgi:RNA recognition motif-containing protein